MKLWENYKIDFNYADAHHMPVKFLAIYFVINTSVTLETRRALRYSYFNMLLWLEYRS